MSPKTLNLILVLVIHFKKHSMRFILIVLLLLGIQLKSQQLLPQPNSISLAEGQFLITPSTKFRVKSNSKQLNEYVSRMVKRMEFKSETFFKSKSLQDTISSHEILIEASENIDTITTATDESYELKVSKNQIHISANTNIGAYRGIETLLQLIQKDNREGAYIKGIIIKDNPRFPWRGLLIDVCRHWIPKHIIKRNIDAMAAVKMNVLHLHLSEDQGFRIESKKFPKLHQLGNNGDYFTQDDIKEILSYAHSRGVRVVPELDIPGHVTSWLVGYPELASVEQDFQIENEFGVFNPSLNPAEENTYDFLDTLLTELSGLFPDQYFHIGGDENNGKHWDANKKIQKFKIKNELNTNEELQAYFNQRVHKILQRNSKKMIGWDEILDSKLPKSIAIQSWRGKESMKAAAQQGFGSILSYGFYLDKVYSLQDYYSNDPLPATTTLNKNEQSLILGGEATMWSELVDHTNIESRIWPATLAIAERLWSNPNNCNLKKFYGKVPAISSSLQEFGLEHLSFQDSKLGLITNNAEFSFSLPFIKALEPLDGYKRHQVLKGTNKYTTTAPFNRLADALYTESFSARNFNKLMIGGCTFQGRCKYKENIKHWLALWMKSSESFQKIIYSSKSLKEIEQLAYNVQELCELAWRKVNSPSELNENENDRAIKLIEAIESLKLEVHFAPLKGIKKIFPKD